MSARIRNLSAHYIPGIPVLRSVSLEAPPGQVTTVLGESGSGKTTLLRVLAGLHPASSGQVLLDGQDMTHVPVEKRGVGLVPQEGALFQHLNVAGNIAYGLRGVRRRVASRHPRVLEMLALVGLEGLGERMPHELSGGQQQRVALARALAPQPRMLLLDEPFSALDPTLRIRVREEVFAILREQNLPTMLITHDQQEALSCSDQVAVLREGQIIQAGTPQEVYFSPTDAWVASFVGDASIVPSGALRDGRGRTPCLVRPENVTFHPCVSQSSSQPCSVNALHGRVRGIRFMGHCRLVDIALCEEADDISLVVARVAADMEVPDIGTLVCVEVGPTLHSMTE